MACCGRGNKSKGGTVTTWRAPVQTTPSEPKVPERQIPIATPTNHSIQPPKIQQTLFTPQQNKPQPQPTPKSTPPPPVNNDLPKCRYREFKSKQIIGGREIENYYCKAFSMNVRQEHCKACQKHDK